MRNESMQKFHPDETCIEMNGLDDRVLSDGSIVDMSAWIPISKAIAENAHEWFEALDDMPEWLNIQHTKRYVRTISTYVYPAESTRWAGQFDEANRKIKLNVAKMTLSWVKDVCVHETAHCWFDANIETNRDLQEFVNVIMSNLHAIDSYSRGRKLQGYKRKHPMSFVNEIHSILATLKHGSETGECSIQALEQDENRTDNEIKWFKIFAKEFDKVHTEKALNKRWVKATQ